MIVLKGMEILFISIYIFGFHANDYSNLSCINPSDINRHMNYSLLICIKSLSHCNNPSYQIG